MIDTANVGSRLAQLSQVGNTNTTTAAGKGGDAHIPPPPGGGPPPGGPLLDALTQALSQLGIGDTASTSQTGTVTAVDSSSATDATADPTQALAAFMQNLMAALHTQSNQGAGADRDGDHDGTGAASGLQGTGYRPDPAADLQSLMQSLTSTGTGTSTSGSTSTANATLTTLQESFQTLVSALGGSNSTATLSSFLQNVANHLSGATSSGNVFSAQA